MKIKMTILGTVIAALGCTVALAAAPSDAGQEAFAPSAAPAPKSAPSVSLGDRMVETLTKAVIAVAVLPAGG